MVGIRKCEAVLTAMNGGDASGIHTRLKYLNLQHFPPGLRVGTAKRADYDLDELLAFALWFSLTQASFQPSTATALVIDFWPEFARLFLAGAEQAGLLPPEGDRSGETLAIISGSALKSISKGGPLDPAGPARPWNVAASRPERLHAHVSGEPGARIVIDLATTLAALLDALDAEPGIVAEGWAEQQLVAMARREGRSAQPEPGGAHPPPALRPRDAPARGDRLRERDYYFARAAELFHALADREERNPVSPRHERLARYLLRPSPREEWKRWVEVGATGVQFVWAAAALIEDLTDVETGVPDTMRIAAANRVGGAASGSTHLAQQLLEAAKTARGYEPLHADSSNVETIHGPRWRLCL